MKSTKTVLAVALVVAAIAYFDSATTANPPTLGTASQCCGPQPEDYRVYRKDLEGDGDDVIIPKVEGPNGFMITLVRADISNLRLYQDIGEGPVEIFFHGQPLHFPAQLPLAAGSTITVTGATGGYGMIIGYVY